MSKTIAILGGGNGAHAAAVDMVKRGFTVRIYEEAAFAANLDQLFKTKEISYGGVLGEGTVKIDMITSDLGAALKGAEYVIVAVPAFAHKAYAQKISSYLEDGQTMLVFAGNFGTLVFLNEMKKTGVNKNVILAETYTLPYAARMQGPCNVLILALTAPILTGVLPSKRTDEAMAKLKDLYPIKPAKSVLESGLYSINPVTHVPGCILNAGRIESQKGEYWFYREAITPGVGRVTEQLDAERVAIVKKLGYDAQTLMESLAAIGGVGKNVHEAITTNEQFAKIKGPDGYKNRYFTEDIPFGLVPWSCVARAIGVATPVMDALVTLSDGLMEQESWNVGRGLEEMGLAGKNLQQILDLVNNG